MFSKNKTIKDVSLKLPAEVNDFIEKKLELLRQYFNITELLNSQLDFDDLTAIIQLLNKRRDLIQNIKKIENRIKRAIGDETQFNTMMKKNEEDCGIYELLKRIESLNRECLIKANQKLSLLRKEITEKKNIIKIKKFYSNKFHHQPRFLDVRR